MLKRESCWSEFNGINYDKNFFFYLQIVNYFYDLSIAFICRYFPLSINEFTGYSGQIGFDYSPLACNFFNFAKHGNKIITFFRWNGNALYACNQ